MRGRAAHPASPVANVAFVAGRLDQVVELCTSLAAGCRAGGRLRLLPFALNHLAYTQVVTGHHRDARDNAVEGLQIASDTGQTHPAAGLHGQLAWLAAVEGDEQRCRPLAEAGVGSAAATGPRP
ncbi:hypothetical protein [Micromonospora chersina]|uniref:hypothetical protein n=1 Tax=Micromonospora chersina TaxID=47854 RepID=UPI0033C40895